MEKLLFQTANGTKCRYGGVKFIYIFYSLRKLYTDKLIYIGVTDFTRYLQVLTSRKKTV